MTTAYPEAVLKLIEALEWRANNLNQPSSTKDLVQEPEELPIVLLLDGTNSSTESFAGYRSMTDFLANSWPNNDTIPWRMMCLVTIGEGVRPHFLPLSNAQHPYDVLATAATLLSYYEGKEKLPSGFAKEVSNWLMDKTNRVGYGTEDMERHADQLGREAVELFCKAILSVTDVTETPIVAKIFEYSTGRGRFAYSSDQSSVIGKATRLFCRTFCLEGHERFNKVLATLFEWKARELLTWQLLHQVGYRYGLDPETTTYGNLPRSSMVGAFAHLPSQPALELPGPDALEA